MLQLTASGWIPVTAGVERFYIRLEESPRLRSLLSSPAWCACVELLDTSAAQSVAAQSVAAQSVAEQSGGTAAADGTPHGITPEHDITPELDVTPHDYFDKVQRQQRVVAAAIPRARAHGLTHLLHIDDDELLYCPRGSAPLVAQLARCLQSESVADIHLANVEALPPGPELRPNLFEGVTCFRHVRALIQTRRICRGASTRAPGALPIMQAHRDAGL